MLLYDCSLPFLTKEKKKSFNEAHNICETLDCTIADRDILVEKNLIYLSIIWHKIIMKYLCV